MLGERSATTFATMRHHGFALAAALLVPTAAQPGCPGLPAEATTLEVSSCRAYRAAHDAEFVRTVNRHFDRFFADLGASARAERIAKIVADNSGAIVSARRPADAAASARDYFFRSADANACAPFAAGASLAVAITRTCPMVFFEAPVDHVLTLPQPR